MAIVYGGKFKDENAAIDHADQLRFESEPVGGGAKLLEQMNKLKWHDAFTTPRGQEIADQLIGSLHEKMSDYQGIKASEFENIIRNHDAMSYLMDYADWASSPGHFLQNTYRDLGHDAAILANADKQFSRMGIAPGTSHIALFDPRRVRSVDAKFDPAKVDSTDLLAGITGAAVIPGLVLSQSKPEKPE